MQIIWTQAWLNLYGNKEKLRNDTVGATHNNETTLAKYRPEIHH